ncbi:uncharacterized protein LOC143146215 [Ptiloglossa arizonensis]|uniref:uncharacterized protein LOC143146215 n=1 Tax=Ptiloglossa arizonensis TaxID=3350558 RepID=UPI003FA17435
MQTMHVALFVPGEKSRTICSIGETISNGRASYYRGVRSLLRARVSGVHRELVENGRCIHEELYSSSLVVFEKKYERIGFNFYEIGSTCYRTTLVHILRDGHCEISGNWK